MTATIKPLLYSYWRSSCAWRVRIALNLKNIDYDLKTIDLYNKNSRGGDQFREEYLKVNPMAQVPALVVDGHTLIESMVILHYLEETRAQPALLPTDAFKRAKVREVCELICSGIQPLQNTIVLSRVGETQEEWAQFFIKRGFTALEKQLESTAGKYCVDNEISLADCCLVPMVYNARNRFSIDMTPYPIISRIDGVFQDNQAFIAAHPDNQPDCPTK